MKRLMTPKVFFSLLLPLLSLSLWAQESNNAYFKKIKNEKVISDPSIVWKNFGPGMSGYCEEFWCHPTDPNVMFMGPDMHVTFGTWDGGKSWKTIKDSDGLGHDLERTHDIQFSTKNPDFGVAIEREGGVYTSIDRGRTWKQVADIGMAHTKLAIHPKKEQTWFIGAGDFWNVKNNHRSLQNLNGVKHNRANYGYILKTTNGGKSFKKIATNIADDLDVGRIIIHPIKPNLMWIATNHGVFKSNNEGKSWESCAKGLPNNLPRDMTAQYDKKTEQFTLLLIEQTFFEENNKTVSAKGGVYKSSDLGSNWENISSNLYFDLKQIHFTAEHDRFYRAIGYWFGISKKEAKQKYPQLPSHTLSVFNRIVVNPLDPNEIHVAFNKKHDFSFGPGDLWSTTDGGKTWKVTARQGKYWLGKNDLKYWNQRNNPTGTNVKFAHLQHYMDLEPARSGNRMLAVNAKGEVFIGIDQQTLKSTDQGGSWFQIDDDETATGSQQWIGRGGSNLPGRFMLLETGIPERRLLCSGEHGLWETTKIGNWKDPQAVAVQQLEGQVNHFGMHSVSTVAVHPKDPDTIYILGWRQSHRGKLRRSKDGGKTWENIATIFNVNSPLHKKLAAQNSLIIDPQNPKNMYFCATHQMISEVSGGRGPKLTKGEYGFYRSFDGGYTWEVSNKGIDHKGASIRRIIMDPVQPTTLYAAGNDNNGGLFKSTDKGSNWVKVKIPAQIKAVNNVFIDRNTKEVFISTGRRTGEYNEGGVWKSKNNGKTWQKIFNAPFVWQAETSPVNPDIIVVSVAGQAGDKKGNFKNPGVYLSKDGGNAWTKINKGLGQPNKIVDVKPDPYNENVLWCASWGCGWFITYLNDDQNGWLHQ
ncbi:sialidase family protein [Flammeovirga sp. EKP202]|uniref:WD40/YVTN/BNR-like repeat-containing protein n=1 Tax=Flammeovirga sp. EKP202 TaxID=2770592 RepID=UPI001CB84A4A|nr:sialidase family protein [Flammeovirga sp. EKP202]